MKQLKSSEEIEEHKKVTIHQKGKKIPQNSSPGGVTGVKIILYIWITRMIPSKCYCKVSKQIIVFL